MARHRIAAFAEGIMKLLHLSPTLYTRLAKAALTRCLRCSPAA